MGSDVIFRPQFVYIRVEETNYMSSTNATEQLIEGLCRNSRVAQERFLRQEAPVVFRFIVRLTQNEQDAEELTQDTLLRAMRNIGKYDARLASLDTWLCRIAYRLTLNHLRSRRRVELSYDEHLELINDADEDALRQALSDTRQTVVELIREAIDALPSDEQTLVTLFYYDDLPLKEIAFIMEAPPGTLATRLHRIRKKLYNYINRQQRK